MATGPLNSLIRHIRRTVRAQNDGESDAALLQRFVAHSKAKAGKKRRFFSVARKGLYPAGWREDESSCGGD
jgi:hypothetical protein